MTNQSPTVPEDAFFLLPMLPMRSRTSHFDRLLALCGVFDTLSEPDVAGAREDSSACCAVKPGAAEKSPYVWLGTGGPRFRWIGGGVALVRSSSKVSGGRKAHGRAAGGGTLILPDGAACCGDPTCCCALLLSSAAARRKSPLSPLNPLDRAGCPAIGGYWFRFVAGTAPPA